MCISSYHYITFGCITTIYLVHSSFKLVVKDFCNYIFEASFDLPKECESFEYENFMDSQVGIYIGEKFSNFFRNFFQNGF